MPGGLQYAPACRYEDVYKRQPDYPAEIRAPQGTVAGVSGFQVHFGSHRELNPGDYCDVLVAMNPAALKANRKWLKPGATVIIDGDSITEDHLKKMCIRDSPQAVHQIVRQIHLCRDTRAVRTRPGSGIGTRCV